VAADVGIGWWGKRGLEGVCAVVGESSRRVFVGEWKGGFIFYLGGCKAGIAVALMGQHKPFIPF
jgi:hypothetical protein